MIQSDEELIRLSTQGDDSSFQELMRRYLKPIYNFIRQYVKTEADADDATQDTFFKAWKHLKRFKDGNTFKSWIYTIARNTALDHLKKKKAVHFSALDNQEQDIDFADTLKDAEPLAAEIFERAELTQELNQALETLHPDHRAIMVMHYHEEMTFEEISEAVDVPMNTVKSWHHRSLIKIREYWKKKKK